MLLHQSNSTIFFTTTNNTFSTKLINHHLYILQKIKAYTTKALFLTLYFNVVFYTLPQNIMPKREIVKQKVDKIFKGDYI